MENYVQRRVLFIVLLFRGFVFWGLGALLKQPNEVRLAFVRRLRLQVFDSIQLYCATTIAIGMDGYNTIHTKAKRNQPNRCRRLCKLFVFSAVGPQGGSQDQLSTTGCTRIGENRKTYRGITVCVRRKQILILLFLGQNVSD